MNSTVKPTPRSMSRTVVTAVVGLLVVVAIVGIVLAGRRPAKELEGTTPAAVVPMTTTPSVVASAPAAPEPLPTSIRFEPASERLSPKGFADIARLADAMRLSGQSIALTARFARRDDRAAASLVSKKRVDAIQHALQANGVTASRIRGEMIELAPGAESPDAVDQISVVLH